MKRDTITLSDKGLIYQLKNKDYINLSQTKITRLLKKILANDMEVNELVPRIVEWQSTQDIGNKKPQDYLYTKIVGDENRKKFRDALPVSASYIPATRVPVVPKKSTPSLSDDPDGGPVLPFSNIDPMSLVPEDVLNKKTFDGNPFTNFLKFIFGQREHSKEELAYAWFKHQHLENYNKLLKNGYTTQQLEQMGIQRPNYPLGAMGGGSSIPELPIPIPLPRAETADPTPEEIQRLARENARAERLLEQQQQRVRITGLSPVSKQKVRATRGRVYGNTVLNILNTLATQRLGGLTVERIYSDRTNTTDTPFNRVWKGSSNEFKNRVIHILNDYGIDLNDVESDSQSIKPIVNQIMSFQGGIPIDLNNAITEAFEIERVERAEIQGQEHFGTDEWNGVFQQIYPDTPPITPTLVPHPNDVPHPVPAATPVPSIMDIDTSEIRNSLVNHGMDPNVSDRIIRAIQQNFDIFNAIELGRTGSEEEAFSNTLANFGRSISELLTYHEDDFNRLNIKPTEIMGAIFKTLVKVPSVMNRIKSSPQQAIQKINDAIEKYNKENENLRTEREDQQARLRRATEIKIDAITGRPVYWNDPALRIPNTARRQDTLAWNIGRSLADIEGVDDPLEIGRPRTPPEGGGDFSGLKAERQRPIYSRFTRDELIKALSNQLKTDKSSYNDWSDEELRQRLESLHFEYEMPTDLAGYLSRTTRLGRGFFIQFPKEVLESMYHDLQSKPSERLFDWANVEDNWDDLSRIFQPRSRASSVGSFHSVALDELDGKHMPTEADEQRSKYDLDKADTESGIFDDITRESSSSSSEEPQSPIPNRPEHPLDPTQASAPRARGRGEYPLNEMLDDLPSAINFMRQIRGDSMASWRNWRLRRYRRINPDDDPDDPNDPVYIIDAPNGRRRIRRSMLVLCLALLGVGVASIVAVLKRINTDETKEISITKNKDGNNKDTMDTKPVKPSEDPFLKLPPNKVPNIDISPVGANKITLTDQLKELGLTPAIQDFNLLIDDYNKAVVNRDIPLMNKLKNQLIKIYNEKIRDPIQLKDRPYASTGIPTKRYLDPKFDPNKDFSLTPVFESDGVNLQKLPPNEFINADLRAKYDAYVADYNSWNTWGNKYVADSYKSQIMNKLNDLVKQIKEDTKTPASTIKPFTDEDQAALDKSKLDLKTARQNYFNILEHFQNLSKDPTVDKHLLERYYIKLNEERNALQSIYQRDKDLGLDAWNRALPRTNLSSYDLETLPKTQEDRVLFDKLQIIEQHMKTHVNPSDRTNQLDKDYQTFVRQITPYTDIERSLSKPSEVYTKRLDKLRELYEKYGMKDKFDELVKQQETDLVKDPTVGDDGEPTVDFQDTEGIHAEENEFRPDTLDPAEAKLFLSTKKEIEEEKKRWEAYSLVEAGFGLGNPHKNPLARENLRTDIRRYSNNYKAGASNNPWGTQLPYKTPVAHAKPSEQPIYHNIYENEYGQVFFEDAFENKSMQKFTHPYPHSNHFSDWENSRSIYHPENCLHTYHPKPTFIPEIRTSGKYFGVPSTQVPSKYGYTSVAENNITWKMPMKGIPTDSNSVRINTFPDIKASVPKSGSTRF